MQLSPVEQRVVGCLIEKERATPQNYPLTLNALRLACNQASNRDPVLDLDEAEIELALGSLRESGLTRIVYSTSNRAAKYRHVLDEALHLDDDELAALAVLMLRGPQTLGEIKGRTDRLYEFSDLAAVHDTLERLADRAGPPLARQLDRRPGQKDPRWIHLLGPTSDARTTSGKVSGAGAVENGSIVSAESACKAAVGARGLAESPNPAALRDRVEPPDDLVALVDAVELLRHELVELRYEFDTFREQFG